MDFSQYEKNLPDRRYLPAWRNTSNYTTWNLGKSGAFSELDVTSVEEIGLYCLCIPKYWLFHFSKVGDLLIVYWLPGCSPPTSYNVLAIDVTEDELAWLNSLRHPSLMQEISDE